MGKFCTKRQTGNGGNIMVYPTSQNTEIWAPSAAHTSGMSIKLWCVNHEITYRRYNYWVKKLQYQPRQWAQVIVPHKEVKGNEVKLYCGK